MDLVGILIDFLHQIDPNQETYQRDTAARICVILIEACGYDSCQQKAKDFHNWFHVNGLKYLSKHGQTFVISQMMKINELASEFYDMNGIKLLLNYLQNDCQADYQLAYNVIISFWILSFHEYARRDFEDYDLMLVEKIIKILDYFNKEKVVRAVLLLLQSLSSSKKALEIISDLSCLELIEKLQQRHWVDKDI